MSRGGIPLFLQVPENKRKKVHHELLQTLDRLPWCQDIFLCCGDRWVRTPMRITLGFPEGPTNHLVKNK
jgi:hypothetical protein